MDGAVGDASVKEQRYRMRQQLASATRAPTAAMTVILGDFNWVCDADDRFHKQTGTFTGAADAAEQSHWATHVERPLKLHELRQPEVTHGGPISRARLDRVYWNAHISHQIDKVIVCSALNWRPKRGMEERRDSQHRPVSFVRRPAAGNRFALPPPPPWVFRHPDWATRTAMQYNTWRQENIGRDLGPCKRVLAMKTAMREVADQIRSEHTMSLSSTTLASPPAAVADDELAWTMRFIKAAESGNLAAQDRCCREYPVLAAMRLSGLTAVRDHAVDLAKRVAVQELRDIQEDAENGEDDVEVIKHRRSQWMLRLRRLAPGRSAALGAIRTTTGRVVTSSQEMGTALRMHWRGIFKRRRHHAGLLQTWLKDEFGDMRVPHWQVTRADLRKAIQMAPTTSPGPDGMPPRAWKAAGCLAEEVLWDALQVLQDPTRHTEVDTEWASLNESTMVFLPKLEEGQIGDASEVRPLNISNGENRILANAVRYGMERVMQDWVSGMQRGFLPGRSMILNVIDVEHGMQVASLRGDDGAAFLFDFKAAFPSIIHSFLFDVLKFIGVPAEIMAFIQNLYANNRCSMIVGGERLEGFTMECGIRQGCPLSPLIFAVAMDVLLLRTHRLFPHAMVRAYADDFAVIMHDAWSHASALKNLRQDFALRSGLDLNLSKTAMIPLTVGDPERHRAWIIQVVPEWALIQLKHSGKYLGFILGPARGELSFSPAVHTFRRRTLQWQAAAGGSNLSLLAYKVYILPILQFVVQLDNPPAGWEVHERWALQRLLGG